MCAENGEGVGLEISGKINGDRFFSNKAYAY